VENLHVNFTIVVYSPPKITSLFYSVSKFSYFCICNTPLNCYYFTHQSYPFAHLTSFRRITKFTTVYRSSVIQLPFAPIASVRSLINTVLASVFILEQTEYDSTFF